MVIRNRQQFMDNGGLELLTETLMHSQDKLAKQRVLALVVTLMVERDIRLVFVEVGGLDAVFKLMTRDADEGTLLQGGLVIVALASGNDNYFREAVLDRGLPGIILFPSFFGGGGSLPLTSSHLPSHKKSIFNHPL